MSNLICGVTKKEQGSLLNNNGGISRPTLQQMLSTNDRKEAERALAWYDEKIQKARNTSDQGAAGVSSNEISPSLGLYQRGAKALRNKLDAAVLGWWWRRWSVGLFVRS